MKLPWKEETPYTMKQLLESAEVSIAERDYLTAQVFLERAASASNLPAMYRLACFYRDTPELSMTQQVRFSLSEKILLYLENILTKHEDLMVICRELATLYKVMKRPVSFLGYKFREYHLSATPDSQLLSMIKSGIKKLDLTSSLASDPRGSAILGLECCNETDLKQTGIFFLQEGVSHGDSSGTIALMLSDILSEAPADDEDSRKLAGSYRRIAAERGNPDILVRKECHQ